MSDGCKWYVLQVKSGAERTVLKVIENSIKSCEGGDDVIQEVFLPTDDEKEGVHGVKSKLIPGYLFVKMNMSKVHVRSVLAIPSVARFLGDYRGAKIVSEDEIKKIKDSIDNLRVLDKVKSSFQVGDEVKIIVGPFQSFCGKVEYVDCAKKSMKVLIVIFGRSTPVDLEAHEVEKVS